MRVTSHNARGVKRSSKGFSPKHNDRQFDITKADHIDPEKDKANLYYNWTHDDFYYTSQTEGIEDTFEDGEKEYYREHFYGMYRSQQLKHEKSRHKGRLKTFDEWMQSKRYCPEETVFQVGKKGETITDEQFMEFAKRVHMLYDEYAKDHNDCYKILNVAMHLGETTGHVHMRKVWQYNSSGMFDFANAIGQEEALERAGVELPDPTKEKSKYNNRKMVFDREMREKIFEICEDMGLEIETVPLENVKHDMSKEQYIAEQNAKQIAEQEKRIAEQAKQIAEQEKRIEEQERIAERNRQRISLQQETMRSLQEDITEAEKQAAQIVENAKEKATRLIEERIAHFDKSTALAVAERNERLKKRELPIYEEYQGHQAEEEKSPYQYGKNG